MKEEKREMNETELNLKLYRKIYLIRKSEEKIREHYMEDEMKTPVHLSIGEEAIAAGVCQALNAEDQIFGTYRSHGIYLAKTGETDKFFAELYGKQTGIAKGKSGSMHLSAPDSNFLGTSAVVATTIPVAVGASFVNKRKNNGRLVAVFFGDGALDEGVFWESLNFACLKELPIIFICEDNGLAIHSPTSDRQGYKSISDIVSRFKCNVFREETTDPQVIYKLTRNAIKLQRSTHKPSFLHLKYYRYFEHVGMNQDFKFGYRSEEEFKKWYKVDPVNLQRKKLLENAYSEKEIEEIESEIDKQIDNSVKLAQKAPFPDDSELFKGVYE
jgi:TPP-dependent pyruvate/acetoin dehydrogenase alpha subunit